MAARETKQAEREHQLDDEIEMYRKAATEALDQLAWVIGYLNQIRKSQIAAVLDRTAGTSSRTCAR